MAQPPDDRRPLPWETPREPEATTPPSEADGGSAGGSADAAREPVPDDAPTVLTPTPGEPAEPVAPAPTDQPAPAAPAEPDAPANPLISWTPSGAAAAGAAAAAGVGPVDPAVPTAAVPPAQQPGAPGSPIVGWQAPAATPDASAVQGYAIAGVGSRLVAYFFDIFLVSAVLITVLVIAFIGAPGIQDEPDTLNLLTAILSTGLSFLYFVGFWTSGGAATLGMRLLALRIVAAPMGGPLSITSAIIRWVAFGYPLTFLTILPGIGYLASLALTVWTIVLLLTTATSDTKQGIHDRWAGSAIIRRIGASDTPAVIGCILLIALILGLFILLPILLLFSLDPVVIEEILSEVGQSI
jgi:uncharacterized RDD family membrane protein YckC